MAIANSIMDDPATAAAYCTSAVVGSMLIWVLLSFLAQPPLPSINYSPFDLSYAKAKRQFATQARQLLAAGFAKFKGRPFCVIAELGPRIILPPDAVDAVNKEPALSFDDDIAQQFFADSISGFEAFRQPAHGLIPTMVRTKITQNLMRFMDQLSGEMQDVLCEEWEGNKEWHARHLRTDVLRIISRLSARVFVGSELGRNEEWLRIAVDFAVRAIVAAREVRMWPAPLRPLVHWFLPNCRELRRTIAEGRKLVGPVVKARREARASGKRHSREEEDCIDWLDDVSDGKIDFDPVVAQLGLALASIHTTSDLLGQTLINLCLYPEWFDPLRKEAVDVVRQHGLTKTGMHQLQLLDAFLKETQRLKPASIVTSGRLAMQTFTLPDGTRIPKGTTVAVSSHRLWDPDLHEDPNSFDPNRFIQWRSTPGQDFKRHLVSTSVDHPAFGHGKHACPGRFFAANETKIALVHILLKYDLAFTDDSPKPTPFGVDVAENLMPDPRVMVKVRKRDAEVSI